MSHRHGLFLLLAVMLAFFSPVLVRGEVIFPHVNDLELGLPLASDDDRISNRRFSDASSVFVPETHVNLRGNNSSWLATWNPHVELGRPVFQPSPFSKAFLFTHLLSFFNDDPFVVFTWVSVLGVGLVGFFAYLFLQILQLRPVICFMGSAGLALGVPVIYWLAFPMYVWAYASALALLWLVSRFLERATWTGGLGIGFCVYAMLMTSYPQLIVWHGYLLVGFTLFHLAGRRATRSHSEDTIAIEENGLRRSSLNVVLSLAAAVGFGLMCAAPAYLDAAINTMRSARVEADPSFFTFVLPVKEGWQQLVLFLVQAFDVFWFGNPIDPSYPFGFRGLSLTPLFAVLVLLSFVDPQMRRLWPWQLFVGICFLLTVWPAAYVFGVHYLGLGFSRSIPLRAAYIPAMVLAAYCAEHILTRGMRRPWLAIGLMGGAVAIAATGLLALRHPVELEYLAAGLGIFAAVAAFVRSRSPVLLVALVLVGVFHYGWRLMLTRPPSEIHRSSPLVERIRDLTEGGSRFAWVHARVIPANQETLLGLRSIHTYNSISSRNYQEWVLRLSDRGTVVSGRHFRSITSDSRLGSTELGYSGIGTLISREPLDESIGREVARHGDFGLYRTLEQPLLEAQIEDFSRQDEGHVTVEGALREARLLSVERSADQNDYLRFQLTASDRDTVLFVSQQAHPQWQAWSGDRRLETVVVNGFYQGVIVPPGITDVELSFRPYVRWSWLPQVFFVAAALAASVRHFRSSRPSG